MFRTNPFPGVNPFLEQRWEDFHGAFIIAIRDSVNSRLPSDLVARSDTTTYVDIYSETRPERSTRRRPDVRITETSDQGGAVAVLDEVFVADKPTRVIVTEPDAKHRYIEIREATPGNRVVTLIELVSPTNKRSGNGRKEYLKKQKQCVEANINLVEIDLIRSGKPVTMCRRFAEESLPPYHTCVTQFTPKKENTYWGHDLTERLPTIFIPLRKKDTPLVLPLQPLYNRCFEVGRYIDIDYAVSLSRNLDDAERSVVDQTLQSQPK